MPSHLRVPELTGDLPASLSAAALTGLLRGELGFAGVIVSDGLEMRAVSEPYGIPEAAVQAVMAGTDLLCLGRDIDQLTFLAVRTAIMDAVRSGRLPGERLEEAAARVAELRSWTAKAALRAWARRRAGRRMRALACPTHRRPRPVTGGGGPRRRQAGHGRDRRAAGYRVTRSRSSSYRRRTSPSARSRGAIGPWLPAEQHPPGQHRHSGRRGACGRRPAAGRGRGRSSLIIVVRDAHRHPVATELAEPPAGGQAGRGRRGNGPAGVAARHRQLRGELRSRPQQRRRRRGAARPRAALRRRAKTTNPAGSGLIRGAPAQPGRGLPA